MKAPKKPTKSKSEKFADDSSEDSLQPKAKGRFDDEDDDADFPLDDLGLDDEFGSDFDDDDDF